MKDKTTMTVYRKSKKIIKDLTNRYDYKTQADFIDKLLEITKQFRPELKGVKK